MAFWWWKRSFCSVWSVIWGTTRDLRGPMGDFHTGSDQRRQGEWNLVIDHRLSRRRSLHWLTSKTFPELHFSWNWIKIYLMKHFIHLPTKWKFRRHLEFFSVDYTENCVIMRIIIVNCSVPGWRPIEFLTITPSVSLQIPLPPFPFIWIKPKIFFKKLFQCQLICMLSNELIQVATVFVCRTKCPRFTGCRWPWFALESWIYWKISANSWTLNCDGVYWIHSLNRDSAFVLELEKLKCIFKNKMKRDIVVPWSLFVYVCVSSAF